MPTGQSYPRSNLLLSTIPLILLIQNTKTWIKCIHILFCDVTCMTSNPTPHGVPAPIWNLMSRVFIVLISLSILSSELQPERPTKLAQHFRVLFGHSAYHKPVAKAIWSDLIAETMLFYCYQLSTLPTFWSLWQNNWWSNLGGKVLFWLTVLERWQSITTEKTSAWGCFYPWSWEQRQLLHHRPGNTGH